METILEIRVNHAAETMTAYDPNGERDLVEVSFGWATRSGMSEGEAIGAALKILAGKVASDRTWLEGGE